MISLVYFPIILINLLPHTGYQLLYNNPFIYAWNMPSALSSVFPVLERVMAGDRPSSAPWYRSAQLLSQGGKTFTSFAKYKNFDQG